MKTHKNFAIISLCFVGIHMLFNQFYYGNHFFMRPIDFYFMNGLEDIVNFRKDVMFLSTEYSPYLLFHRSIIFAKNLFGVKLESLMWFYYFFANWGLMNAYLYFSQAMFDDYKVSVFFIGLLAFNFAPWTLGSAFGLSTHVIAPNMVAIIFQVLAIACFLKKDNIIFVFIFLAIAFYFHLISTLFICFAIFSYIIYRRKTFKTKELYLSLLTLFLMLIPLIIWTAVYAFTTLKGVPLETWQLDAIRHSTYGHISMSLIWAYSKAYHLGFYFVGLSGFLLVLFKYGNKLSSPDKIEKVKFITAILLCSAAFFSLASDLYLKSMSLQALKSTLWFIQLFIGIFIVKIISDTLFSDERFNPRLFFLPYLYSIAILCTTLNVVENHNKYFKIVIFLILFSAYYFRDKLSLLTQVRASQKIITTSNTVLISFFFIAITILLYQRWIYIEKSEELFTTGSAYSLHNKNWDDIMVKVNELPSDAYILYPFNIADSYYARAKRPGFYNYAYISYLIVGNAESIQATNFVVDLFKIKDSFNGDSIVSAWKKLTKNQVLEINKKFKVTHFINENSKEFDFPVVHKNSEYTLYQIDS